MIGNRKQPLKEQGPSLKAAPTEVDACGVTRGSRVRSFRFGKGVVSMPLWLRLAITAPFAFVAIALTQAFFHGIGDGSAALALLLLGLLARAAWVILPSVWHSTAEWQHKENAASLLERQLQDALDERVRHHPGLDQSDPKP